MTVLFAHNRLDLRNYVNITNLVVQLILAVLLFFILGPFSSWLAFHTSSQQQRYSYR